MLTNLAAIGGVFTAVLIIVSFVLILVLWFRSEDSSRTNEEINESFFKEIENDFSNLVHEHPEVGKEIPRALDDLSYALNPIAVGSRLTQWKDNPEIEVPIATDLNDILRPVAIGSKDVQWGPGLIPVATDTNDYLQPAAVGSKNLKWGSLFSVSSHPADVLRPVVAGTAQVKWEEHTMLLKTLNMVHFHAITAPIVPSSNCVIPAGMLATGGCVHFRMMIHRANVPRRWIIELIQGATTVPLHIIVGEDNARDHIFLQGDIYATGTSTSILLQEGIHSTLRSFPGLNFSPCYRILETTDASIDPTLEMTVQLHMTGGGTGKPDGGWVWAGEYVYYPAVLLP